MTLNFKENLLESLHHDIVTKKQKIRQAVFTIDESLKQIENPIKTNLVDSQPNLISELNYDKVKSQLLEIKKFVDVKAYVMHF